MPTLGDLLKACQPASRNVAVAGKDRAAVMMSGHHADQRWYWDGKTFATDLKGAAVPRSVTSVNQAVAATIAAGSAAARGAGLMPGQVARRSRSTAAAHRSATARFARGRRRRHRASAPRRPSTARRWRWPRRWSSEMRLGQGPATDVLSVGLAATDYVGHSYGTDGAEMCLQLLALDRELGDFLALLDRAASTMRSC